VEECVVEAKPATLDQHGPSRSHTVMGPRWRQAGEEGDAAAHIGETRCGRERIGKRRDLRTSERSDGRFIRRARERHG